ncbi:MAG: MBL fold metallo-hydrolase [Ruminococcus sp.]|nr:MBL fold metallo-hydrolase [Ruminococcus sp.]
MLKKIVALILCALMTLSFCACAGSADIKTELSLNSDVKEASTYTKKINSAVYNELDFSDKSEFENATKGLIEAPESLEIKDENGNVVWSQNAYAFLDEYDKAPDTANPSLWENTKNNHAYGLFKVVDGIYQVRGYDITNLTVVEGETGYIVFDPMMSVECAQAAIELVYKNLGKKPIKAVIVSHSHADHFGGIKAVMTQEQRADSSLSIEEQLSSGQIPIIVPVDFEEYAVSENLYAGMAMKRRANYQYGGFLQEGVTGSLGMGIGMGQSSGMSSYISPTYEIKQSGEKIVIDGVTFEFQLTPGTEAPTEMNTWLPQYNALWIAENCTSTLHNLYTLRGAQIRDGEIWAKYITQAISLYGDKVEVVFQSHNWPHWGNENINEYLINTAAVYKYINDQTLSYINRGYTSDEISNMIKLPKELNKVWYTRQYYGTVAHNAKAVYQKYMGWYDANPVNLNPLEPSESAKKWVEYLGDTDEVLKKAKRDFENGEYQWVAEITNVLVFADPENEAARLLCADALEQLGYQSESGTWRNVYLSAALELRNSNQAKNSKDSVATGDAQKSVSASSMLQYIAIMLNRDNLQGENFTVNMTISDTKENFGLNIVDGVMLIYEDTLFEKADVSVVCPKIALSIIMSQNTQKLSDAVKLEGDAEKFYLLAKNADSFDTKTALYFNIVEP